VSIILDASTAVDLVTDQGQRTLLARQAVTGHDLFAPSLIDLEVANAIARLERAGDVTSVQGSVALRQWSLLAVSRCPDVVLLDDVWRSRQSLRIADAFYVALAALLGYPLVTSDARLARAPHTGVSVVLVGAE